MEWQYYRMDLKEVGVSTSNWVSLPDFSPTSVAYIFRGLVTVQLFELNVNSSTGVCPIKMSATDVDENSGIRRGRRPRFLFPADNHVIFYKLPEN